MARLNSPIALVNDFYALGSGSEAIRERVKEMRKHMASQHDAARGAAGPVWTCHHKFKRVSTRIKLKHRSLKISQLRCGSSLSSD